MARLAPGFLGLVLFAVWVFSIVDVFATDRKLIRNLPRGVWLVIVTFLPPLGPIAWLGLGRPRYAAWWPGGVRDESAGRRRSDGPRRPLGPEDRDDWEPPRGSGPGDPRPQ